jgi:hypothetical protein
VKAKFWGSVLVAISLFVAYSLGYDAGYKQAFKGRVFYERDATDITGVASTRPTGGFDPYFVKVNQISVPRK